MSLVLANARFHLLETRRILVAVLGSTLFPAASILFFVVPFTGSDPTAATYATASMVTFAVMTSNLSGTTWASRPTEPSPGIPTPGPCPPGRFPALVDASSPAWR